MSRLGSRAQGSIPSVSVIPPARFHRICQGVTDGPPPPLAGALAAWLSARGNDFRVVDPRGSTSDWSGEGPLWVHLEGGNWSRIEDQVPSGSSSLYFFGPEASLAAAAYPSASLVSGDPESQVRGAQDGPIAGSSLPITTYSGFGPQPGGLFRILAGRYGQGRPLPTLLREVVYLVETFGAGHLLFDDEDLSRYGDLLPDFEAELKHLPWALTWEGTAGGLRVRAAREFPNARL